MIPQEIINKQNTLAQSTSTALNSLKEYLTSVRSKMMRWTAQNDDSNESICLAVTTIDNPDLKKMVTLSRAQYQLCVDDPDGENISLNTSSDSLENFSREEILSAVEDVMSESGAQYEFVDYVMNRESVDVASFTTYLKSKYTAMSNQLIEKYGQYLSSGDPITALTNYFSSIELATVNKDQSNQYISVVAASAFTGTSVWSIIWTDFKNKVSELFEGVWTDLLHLQEFFRNLFQRVIELGRWLLSKIAKPLTTNYEKAGANFGILDLPITQFKLGTLNIVSRDNVTITSSSYMDKVAAISKLYWRKIQDLSTGGYACIREQQYNEDWYYVSPTGSEYGGGASVNLAAMLNHFAKCLVEWTDDGIPLVRPFDVVIPISDFIVHDFYDPTWKAAPDSVVFRIGVDQNMDVYFQLFAAMPKSIYDTFYDAEIAQGLMRIPDCLRKLGQRILPFSFVDNSDSMLYNNVVYSGGNYAIDYYTGLLFFSALSNDEKTSTGPIDLVSHLTALNYEDLLNDDTVPYAGTSDWPVWMIAARFMGCVLIPLTFMNSPDLDKNFESVEQVNQVLGLVNNTTTYGGKYTWNAIPPLNVNEIKLPTTWLTVYRPYCNSALIANSIHYQTLRERASELEKYIVGAIIAIAAVIVTIKVAKFIRARNVKYEVASAYAENLAYELPSNPTASQVSNYVKARRKARTIARHNALLGITTTYAANAGLNGAIESISNQLLGTQGYSSDQDEAAPTVRDIQTLIRGR